VESLLNQVTGCVESAYQETEKHAGLGIEKTERENYYMQEKGKSG